MTSLWTRILKLFACPHAGERVIEVTARDTDLGVRSGPGYCPIARAVARSFGQPECLGVEWVCVSPSQIRIFVSGQGEKTAQTPWRVARWMKGYDRGKGEPFTFRATFLPV
jgi:hypothetical protein